MLNSFRDWGYFEAPASSLGQGHYFILCLGKEQQQCHSGHVLNLRIINEILIFDVFIPCLSKVPVCRADCGGLTLQAGSGASCFQKLWCSIKKWKCYFPCWNLLSSMAEMTEVVWNKDSGTSKSIKDRSTAIPTSFYCCCILVLHLVCTSTWLSPCFSTISLWCCKHLGNTCCDILTSKCTDHSLNIYRVLGFWCCKIKRVHFLSSVVFKGK